MKSSTSKICVLNRDSHLQLWQTKLKPNQHALILKASGPQSPSGRFGEEKLSLPGIVRRSSNQQSVTLMRVDPLHHKHPYLKWRLKVIGTLLPRHLYAFMRNTSPAYRLVLRMENATSLKCAQLQQSVGAQNMKTPYTFMHRSKHCTKGTGWTYSCDKVTPKSRVLFQNTPPMDYILC